MTDRIFFPATAAAAGLFALLALQPWSDRPPSGPVSGGGRDAQDITVEGRELYRLRTGEAGEIRIVSGESGAPVAARLTLMPRAEYAEPQSGPYLTLAEDVELALESRPIEITIVARAVGEFAAERFEANYVARPGVESDWRSFALTAEFAPHVMTWTTPPVGGELGYDHLGLRPAPGPERRTMDIQSIRIRAAGPRIEPPPS
jgi:hypothetical protein